MRKQINDLKTKEVKSKCFKRAWAFFLFFLPQMLKRRTSALLPITYSIAAVSKHRRNRTEPVSEYAVKCDNVNQHWIGLIKEYLELNPDLVFFIENPRGMLRHMPWMKDFKRHTVWYCKYGDDRAKPTDIWTNSKTWTPRLECHNYKYDKEGNIINKHCHHESARRGARTGTQGKKDSYNRSKIPKELCIEILKSIY